MLNQRIKLPPRVETRDQSAARYLQRSILCWKLALLTFPLDFLLLYYGPRQTIDSPMHNVITAGLLALGLVFGIRPLAWRLLSWFRRSGSLASRWHDSFVGLLVLVLFTAALVQFFMTLSEKGPISRLVALAAAYAVAIWSAFHNFSKTDSKSGEQPVLSVNDLFLLSLGRVVLARLILPWAVIGVLIGASQTLPLGIAAAASLLLLFNAAPAKFDYFRNCRGCAISFVFTAPDGAFCPSCSKLEQDRKAACPSSKERRSTILEKAARRLEAIGKLPAEASRRLAALRARLNSLTELYPKPRSKNGPDPLDPQFLRQQCQESLAVNK